MILMSRLLAKEFQNKGIAVYSQHPGVVSTDLGRELGWVGTYFFKWLGIPAQKGADNLIYLSNADRSTLISGEYYYKKKVKQITTASYDLDAAAALLAALDQRLQSTRSSSLVD
jgi:NAD(P)-dependent dehydrogenase (short-subunit alcohol dehydrogenase family)